jgi:hypothetical protein
MIRIGQNLFKERAFLIRKQVALAKEIKSGKEKKVLSKPPPSFFEISKLQKEIQEEERAITHLIQNYSLDRNIN